MSYWTTPPTRAEVFIWLAAAFVGSCFGQILVAVLS